MHIYSEPKNFTTNIITLTTSTITSITHISATSGGNITFNGGAAISARGICWSTNPNPTVALTTKTIDGSGIGLFTSNLFNLTKLTTYYVRAYATNSAETAYGNEVRFATLQGILPTLSTVAFSNVTESTAISGGSITNDGGLPVTNRGVCWNTSPNPTITLTTKTDDGSGVGVFTSNLVELLPFTTYFIRAYATNDIGTAYGNELSFTTTSVLALCGTITDADNNTYNTVKVGTQCWMRENLKTTKYGDGTTITYITDNSGWISQTTGAYCWYNNDIINKNIYGALYNFYTVVDNRKLCPTGWHVPTDADWSTLTTYLGGEDIAGGKLKEIGTFHWASPNSQATDTSRFLALPGGYRVNSGAFNYIGTYGIWWSSSESSSTNAWFRSLDYGSSSVTRGSSFKNLGLSVRCVKD